MRTYLPPHARMRQIRRDTVRPDPPAPAPANVDEALAQVVTPETVFVVEEATPEPVTPEPEDVAVEAAEVPEVPTVPDVPALQFDEQMTKKDLIAVALSAGWKVPNGMSKAAILAELKTISGR